MVKCTAMQRGGSDSQRPYAGQLFERFRQYLVMPNMEAARISYNLLRVSTRKV